MITFLFLFCTFQRQVAHNLSLETVEPLLSKLQSKTTIGNLLVLKAEVQNIELVINKSLADEVYDLQWALEGKVKELFL